MTADEPPPSVNETAASILGFLTLGPMSGWEINDLAQVSVGYFWSMTRSQIYRELKDLAAKGLVTGDETGPRNRQRYHLTDTGKERLHAWLREDPSSPTVRNPFLVKLFFANQLDDEEVAHLIDVARQQHEETAARYEAAIAMASEVSAFMTATATYGRASQQAILDWFDQAPWSTPHSAD